MLSHPPPLFMLVCEAKDPIFMKFQQIEDQ